MELLISDKDEIMLKSRKPFSEEVVRIEFFTDTRLLVIGFADQNLEGELLEVEVATELVPNLKSAGRILVISVDDQDNPIQGFDVPLISIGL
jgi:hypothetical protein